MAAPEKRTLHLVERRPQRCRLAPEDHAHLHRWHRTELEITYTARRHVYHLTPRGYVGVIEAPRCRLLIEPKIPLSNLFYLLHPRASSGPGEGVSLTLLDRVALQLARLLEERVQAGLHRAYVDEATRGMYQRGRLDIAAQVRARARNSPQIHSQIETLSANIPCNQLPRSVADHLLTFPTLQDQARSALRQALRGFEEIDPCSLLVEHLPPSEQGPIEYAPLLDWCQMIVAGLQPGWGQRESAPGFLLDLERIFERYLTEGLARAFAGTGCILQPQVLKTTDAEGGCGPPLQFRPDILVEQGGQLRLVLDVKWKRLPPGATVQDDLYQILAYGSALGIPLAVLVYPGRRNRCRVYRLPGVPRRVEMWTVRVEGAEASCARALRQLAGHLRRQCEEAREG